MKCPIYMDHHATTPVDPRVLKAMQPCFTQDFGNAASRNHSFGRRAAQLVERARGQIADLIGAQAEEIVFTSGATESDNLAIKGVCDIYKERGNHLISCVTEHKAVLDSLKRVEQEGFEITYLPVDKDGLIRLSDLERAITSKTILISIMAANNETGVLQAIDEIGRLARSKNILFHTDAAQAAGKIPLDVEKAHIDLMSLSAHKVYGPKGVGALYVREKYPRVRIAPMMDGGGHEGGLRSGTLNVPGIVGMGEAFAIAERELTEEGKRLTELRERMKNRIFKGLDDVALHGHPTQRLAGNLNISFAYVEAEAFLEAIQDRVALSSGSACSSANPEPSYVIPALGVAKELASCSIRIGLGRFNTSEEVDYVADTIMDTVRDLREKSPLYAMATEGLN